jgi:reactive intermediate/imine deaminase
MRQTIRTEAVAATPSFFSQGVRVGNTIYVSGQVAFDREGKVVGKGDMAVQTRQAIENMKAVLAAAGATLDDVVKVTMFVTDMSLAGQARDVRKEYFVKNPPASTGLEIQALAHPDLLVELEAIAVVEV